MSSTLVSYPAAEGSFGFLGSWNVPRQKPRATPQIIVRLVAPAPRAELIVPPEVEYAAMAYTPDPFGDWIRAHRDELARHVGQFVAIDPDRGILGVGDDPVELARRYHTAERPVMVTFAAEDLYGRPAA